MSTTFGDPPPPREPREPQPPRHYRTEIRGVQLARLHSTPGTRVRWTAWDRIQMAAHLAEFQLDRYKASRQRLDALCRRLGIREHEYRHEDIHLILKRLGDACERKVTELERRGVLARTADSQTLWPVWTRRWAEPGWGGNEEMPRHWRWVLDDAAGTATEVTGPPPPREPAWQFPSRSPPSFSLSSPPSFSPSSLPSFSPSSPIGKEGHESPPPTPDHSFPSAPERRQPQQSPSPRHQQAPQQQRPRQRQQTSCRPVDHIHYHQDGFTVLSRGPNQEYRQPYYDAQEPEQSYPSPPLPPPPSTPHRHSYDPHTTPSPSSRQWPTTDRSRRTAEEEEEEEEEKQRQRQRQRLQSTRHNGLQLADLSVLPKTPRHSPRADADGAPRLWPSKSLFLGDGPLRGPAALERRAPRTNPLVLGAFPRGGDCLPIQVPDLVPVTRVSPIPGPVSVPAPDDTFQDGSGVTLRGSPSGNQSQSQGQSQRKVQGQDDPLAKLGAQLCQVMERLEDKTMTQLKLGRVTRLLDLSVRASASSSFSLSSYSSTLAFPSSSSSSLPPFPPSSPSPFPNLSSSLADLSVTQSHDKLAQALRRSRQGARAVEALWREMEVLLRRCAAELGLGADTTESLVVASAQPGGVARLAQAVLRGPVLFGDVPDCGGSGRDRRSMLQ